MTKRATKLKPIEQILTNCIVEIRSGKSTLDECLNRFSSMRKDLEPLFKVALNIKDPHVINLDDHNKQVTRVQLLQQIENTRQKKSRTITGIFSFGIPQQYVWVRVAILIVAVVMVISIIGGGTAYAAQSSLPGDFLYPVKTGTEDIRLTLASDSAAKAELNMEFAMERLKELIKVANGGEGSARLAVEGYRHSLDATIQQLQKGSTTPGLSELLDKVLTKIQNQVSTCDDLIDSDPINIQLVRDASDMVISGQVQILEILAHHNILRAVEVNADTMRNRLQQALATADTGNYQTMQQNLIQYQQLNQLSQQILQSTQTDSVQDSRIEDLTVRALEENLETLSGLSQQVPQEYWNTIETSIQMAIQLQEQARYGQQGRNGNGTGPGETGSGSIDDSGSGQSSANNTQIPGRSSYPDNEIPVSSTASPGNPGVGSTGDSGTGSGSNPEFGGDGKD